MTLGDRTFELFIPHDDLVRSIGGLAARINADYSGRGVPLFLGVLNGAFMFASELLQRVDFPCEISFVKLSSYDGTCSSGSVNSLIGLKKDIRGRDVIIVEDIVDTGQSIEHMMQSLEGLGASSIEVATMLFKPASYRMNFPIRYYAMDIPNDFIVGFGLDYNELGRNLKDIYKVTDE